MRLRLLLLLLCLMSLSACSVMKERTLVPRDRLQLGVAVDAEALNSDSRYRSLIAQEFSSLTPENAMKMAVLRPAESRFDVEAAQRIAAFASAEGMRLRGHPLLWYRQNPGWISTLTATEARAFLVRHIRETVGYFAGRVSQWDVLNEAVYASGVLRRSIWYELLGPEYIEIAFREAALADAQAKLFLNDFDLALKPEKLKGTLWLADSLREAGLRVDGIAFQMHIRPGAEPTREQIAQAFSLVASRGYRIEVSELDVALPLPVTEQALASQAQMVCSVVAACYAQKACSGVSLWGVSDAHSWIPMALPGHGAATLRDEQYRKKPAYFALQTALRGGACP